MSIKSAKSKQELLSSIKRWRNYGARLFFKIIVKYAQQKMYHFNHEKVSNSLPLSPLTPLHNHHHCFTPGLFHHPNRNSRAIKQSFPIPPFSPLPGNHKSDFFSLWICLFWIFYINGIIQHVAFNVWLLSFTQHVFNIHPCCSKYRYGCLL